MTTSKECKRLADKLDTASRLLTWGMWLSAGSFAACVVVALWEML